MDKLVQPSAAGLRCRNSSSPPLSQQLTAAFASLCPFSSSPHVKYFSKWHVSARNPSFAPDWTIQHQQLAITTLVRPYHFSFPFLHDIAERTSNSLANTPKTPIHTLERL